jgi:hypothetical protein
MQKTWKIVFEDGKGNRVDELEFTDFRKARANFDSLVLQDFAKAVLTRGDGLFMDVKDRLNK